jgi:hypothetical protein
MIRSISDENVELLCHIDPSWMIQFDRSSSTTVPAHNNLAFLSTLWPTDDAVVAFVSNKHVTALSAPSFDIDIGWIEEQFCVGTSSKLTSESRDGLPWEPSLHRVSGIAHDTMVTPVCDKYLTTYGRNIQTHGLVQLMVVSARKVRPSHSGVSYRFIRPTDLRPPKIVRRAVTKRHTPRWRPKRRIHRWGFGMLRNV